MKHSKTLKTALALLVSLGVIACSSHSSPSENRGTTKTNQSQPKTKPSEPKQEMNPSLPEMKPSGPKQEMMPSLPKTKPSEPKQEMKPSQPEMKPSEPKQEMKPSQPEMKPSEPKQEMKPSQPEMKPSEPKQEMKPSQPEMKPSEPKQEMKPSEPKKEMMPSQPEMKPSEPKTEMMPLNPEMEMPKPSNEVSLVSHRPFKSASDFDFNQVKKFVEFNDKGQFTISSDNTYETNDDTKSVVVIFREEDRSVMLELYSAQIGNPFNYQRFGSYTEFNKDFNKRQREPFSFGVVTDPKTLPTSGQYTYKGSTITYSHDDSTIFISKLDANADFGQKKLEISSYDTKRTLKSDPYAPLSDHSNFDFKSSINLEAGKSVFEGKLNRIRENQPVSISGKIQGAFYGPNAEEIGGTFNLIEGNLLHGAFGAQKQ